MHRGRAPKARVESSAVGAKIDAPKVPRSVGVGCLLSTEKGSEEGLCPLPRKFFDFELKKASFSAFWD